ncbi:hypothetical protein ACFQPA_16105 [Halomarina halobia]|uniref:DUF4175 domain-containing protein n=1 Tax=Halomarina halobia TaxID=3033386 RepID=A0ABD6AFS8_9EURY|nr:hypothetical protein [Halomarina sp. PSR21]
MGVNALDRGLWIGFAVLFAVVAGASVLPVEPILWVLPAWGVVVLLSILASIGVAVVAVAAGWPLEGDG